MSSSLQAVRGSRLNNQAMSVFDVRLILLGVVSVAGVFLLTPAPAAADGYLPDDAQGHVADQCQYQPQDDAAEHQRRPDAREFLEQPVEREMVVGEGQGVYVQDAGAELVAAEVNRSHREGVVEPYGDEGERQVQPPPQRSQNRIHGVAGYRHAADEQAHGQRAAGAAAVGMPERRLVDQFPEGAQIPLAAELLPQLLRVRHPAIGETACHKLPGPVFSFVVCQRRRSGI